MTTKHRIIEIVTIIAVTAFSVYMARMCGESLAFEDVSAPIDCVHETIIYKADPVILERKVGATAEVNYRPFCDICGVELEFIEEPNECEGHWFIEKIELKGKQELEAQAIDIRTDYEKRYWEFAKTLIPKEAELKSISETSSTVDMIGVFYRMPGKESNEYKRFFTESGRIECEMKGIDWKSLSSAGREYDEVYE